LGWTICHEKWGWIEWKGGKMSEKKDLCVKIDWIRNKGENWLRRDLCVKKKNGVWKEEGWTRFMSEEGGCRFVGEEEGGRRNGYGVGIFF